MIDVAPTVLEAAGLPEPKTVHGVEQKPIEGVSMRYAFDDAGAAERHETQYFEMFCNRGIYDKGWTAVTRHSIPWVMAGAAPVRTTTPGSSTTRTRTGARRTTSRPSSPRSSRSCKALFMEEARKYNVLPLDDRRVERFNSDLAGRPTLVSGNSQLLFGGMGRLSENSVLNIKNKSHSVTAELAVPEGGAEGVIVAQGGAFAGWSLYVRAAGRSTATTSSGSSASTSRATTEIPPGTHQVRMEFDYDGGGLGKGGTVSLYVDGVKTGEGRVEGTVPMLFSADETCDVGSRHRVAGQRRLHPEESRFTGTVNWVQIDIGEAAEDLDHLISPRSASDRDGAAVGMPRAMEAATLYSERVERHSVALLRPHERPSRAGHALDPGREFAMGSEAFYPEERPVHRVSVDGFWMDEKPVTAADFRRFVRETGYVTVAERPLDPEHYPDADPELLVPGLARLPQAPRAGEPRRLPQLVGICPRRVLEAYPVGRARRSTAGDTHPRSPVAYEVRRRTHAGQELPSEAEWEFAAPAGADRLRRPGRASTSRTARRWRTPGQVRVPLANLKLDGYDRTRRSAASRRTATASST